MKLKRIVSLVLTLCMCLAMLPVITMQANAVDAASMMVSYAQARVNKTGEELGYDDPWCARFVSDAAKAAGQTKAIPYNANAHDLYWAVVRDAGGQVISSPKRGDLVFYSCTHPNCDDGDGIAMQHVGLVEDENYTIEGNMRGGGSSKTNIVKRKGINESYTDSKGHDTSNYVKKVYVRPAYDGATGSHTCNQATYVYYEAAHPHYSCYKCSVCGEVSRNYDEKNYISSCEECINHVCDRGTYKWYLAAHPHHNCYVCSLCEEEWIDATTSNIIDSCLECHRPGKPVLQNIDGKSFVENREIEFTWKETANTTHYNLWFDKKNAEGKWERLDHATYVSSGYQREFPIGEYRCELQSYNSDYWNEDRSDWLHTLSDFVYFSVVSVTPGKPVLQGIDGKHFVENQEIEFTWEETVNTTHYNLWFNKKNKDGNWEKLEQVRYVESGYKRAFDIGEYRCLVQSYNSNYWEEDGSDWLHTEGEFRYFSVDPSYFTVTYDSNGGICPVSSQKVKRGDKLGELPIPEKEGYDFAGWYVTNQGNDTPVTSEETVDSDLTLYAHWANQVYKGNRISFDLNGGYVDGDAHAHALNSINGSRGVGYMIVYNCGGQLVNTNGWGVEYVVNASGEVVNKREYEDHENKLVVPEDGFILSFHLSSTTPTVNEFRATIEQGRYVGYDAENLMAHSYTTQDTYLLDHKYVCEGAQYGILPVPKRDNMIFKGWYTAKDGGDRVTESSDYSTDVLYARWEEIVVTEVEILELPSNTVYQIGDNLDTTGLTLKVSYNDGTTETITTGFEVSGFDSTTAGTKTVIVSYGGKSTSFTATVEKKEETDPNAPQIIVSNATAIVGKQVQVKISLANNPGIVSMMLNVGYDPAVLKLQSVTDAGQLGAAGHSDNYDGNPYVLSWENDLAKEDYVVDGEIVTLTFQVAEDAPVGETAVTVSYTYDNYEIFNAAGEEVWFATVNGSVNVIDVLLGDVNSDGVVNAHDRVYLARYLAKWTDYPASVINMVAADVNCDGAVNAHDRVYLARHLAKWSGYETLGA